MKIKSVEINKFRKLEDVKVDNIGLVNELNGSNGTGKTSFISFLTWMFYGETLDYGANDEMNIDTFNPNKYIGGKVMFDNDYSLARTYGINEDGSIKNDYFYNDRKCKSKTEYLECVKDVFNITNVNIDNAKIKGLNLIRALSDPYYLNNNPNTFRELISKLINLDTYSILFKDERYAPIKNDYDKQKKDFDLCRDYYADSIKNVERDIVTLKNSISSDEDKISNIDVSIDELTKEETDLKSQLDNVITNYNKNLIEKQNALLSKQNELRISIKNDNKQTDSLNAELVIQKKEYNSLVDELNSITRENNKIKMEIESINDVIEKYNIKYNTIKASEFTDIICPNCHTIINETDSKKFNLEKVANLNECKTYIDELIKKRDALVLKETSTIESQINYKIKELNEINDKINNISDFESEETKKIKQEILVIQNEISKLEENKENQIEADSETINQKLLEIREKIRIYNDDLCYRKKIEEETLALKNALKVKAKFDSKLSLLKNYKNEEILLLKKNTTKIFGTDFDFEMLVKNKTNDNYKKVCYASINGLEHIKENTAQYLYYAILMLEKLKKYINADCDIPTIFDIADNLGDRALNKIINTIENSQIFYTKIEFKDNVERNLKVVK